MAGNKNGKQWKKLVCKDGEDQLDFKNFIQMNVLLGSENKTLLKQKELKVVSVRDRSYQMIFDFDHSGLPSVGPDVRTSWFNFREEPGELLWDYGFGVLLTAELESRWLIPYQPTSIELRLL